MLHSRIARIESLMQIELGAILDRELDNPNIPHFVTVYQVKVSKDLSTAIVLVTLLKNTNEQETAEIIKELNRASGYIRTLLAKRVTLKRHPHLRFVFNPSTRYALDIEHLFQQIKREQRPE